MKNLSKKVFCETLAEMERLRRVEDSVNDLFEDEGIEFMSFSYGAYEQIMFNVLDEIFDHDETLAYWIYDLDFGSEYDDPNGLRMTENEEIVPLRTPEDLYDYLTKNT